MHFSSIKERNRLISKGVSNIYLKVIIEKKWGILQFSKFKKCLQVTFWGAATHADIIEFSNFLFQLKNQCLGAKLCVAFQLFWFWKELWRFKVKVSMLFVEQKYKL